MKIYIFKISVFQNPWELRVLDFILSYQEKRRKVWLKSVSQGPKL